MLEEISAVTGTGERRAPPQRSALSNGVKVSALMSPAGNVKQKPLFLHRRRSRQLMRQKKCILSAFTQGVLKLALAAREDGRYGNLTRAATPERWGSRRTCRQVNTVSKQSVKYVSSGGGGR